MSLQESFASIEHKTLLKFILGLDLVVDVTQKCSSQREREEIGETLLELSADWKRILSPMVSFEIVQEVLVSMLRSSKLAQKPVEAEFTFNQRTKLEGLLENMKSLSIEVRNNLAQRHEPWIGVFREQVDFTPGKGGIKRVVNVHELADILTLTNEMKAKAIESFNSHDFGKAITCNIQICNVLQDIRSIRVDENSMIEEMVFDATRNLTIASLKNWEWSRAKSSCDKVFALSTKPDYIINLRRATACRELGQYEEAHNDISTVINSNLKRKDPIVLKALSMKKELLRNQKKSDDLLRKSLTKGMTLDIFSDGRDASSKTVNTSIKVTNMIKKLHHDNNNHSNSAPPATQSSSTKKPAVTKKKNKLLKAETIDIIQRKQFELFSSPDVQASLEVIRFEADLEESRFLHRLLPFKVQIQSNLLEEFGFPPTEVGLKAMERAIAAHMDNREVCARSKELMITIMGDVWSV